MIVIDVGCAKHRSHQGEDTDSVRQLIARFHPSLLLGFDPAAKRSNRKIGDTRVRVTAAAAWTRTGTVPFVWDGNPLVRRTDDALPDGTVFDLVPCSDLAEVIIGLGSAEPIVLKLDCEGAEYELLTHLIQRDVDRLLELVLVEWHGPALHANGITRTLACPVEVWK